MSFFSRFSEMGAKAVSFRGSFDGNEPPDDTKGKAIGGSIEEFYLECETTGKVQIYPLTMSPNEAWDRIKVRKGQHHQTVSPMDPGTPVSPDKLRFVCYSDTHSRTKFIDPAKVPPGDVLLHGGDFTMIGQPQEVDEFNKWLGSLPYAQKIVIAGNHDLMFEESKLSSDWRNFGLKTEKVEESLRSLGVTHVRELLTSCTYLEDAETSVCGLRVYGSPWQPAYGGWAYNLRRGRSCLDMWDLIPEGVDVLMTHGPPIGHGDYTRGGQRAGCVELLHTIQMRVKPTYHVFGHIHEAGGVTTDGSTTYINACTCNLRYRPEQPPVVFDLPIPQGHSKEELLQDLTVISHRKLPPERNCQKTPPEKNLDNETVSSDDEVCFGYDSS